MRTIADKLEDLRDRQLREYLDTQPIYDNYAKKVAEMLRDMKKERDARIK